MSEKSFVVVFPSTFSQKNTSLLAENIKKILKIKNQAYSSIKRDGPLILVDANDPVFASSAINLLFGIKRVSIARQVENKFETVSKEIAKIGANLMLKGDVFYVKVEGAAKGFLPKDLEMAATSSIIAKSSKMDVRPGTEENNSKLLYTFLTKSNAYVTIFSDRGLGGIPYGVHKTVALCCIYDELSATSCIETIKQGFNVRIKVCYREETELTRLVKMINQIIPRTVSKEIEIEFFKVSKTGKRYAPFFSAAMEICRQVAVKEKIGHVSIPMTPLIFSADTIDGVMKKFHECKIITYAPLGALEDEIFNNAREIGLGKFVKNIEKLAGTDLDAKDEKDLKKIAKDAVKGSKKLVIKIGPNNVHEMLDQLIREHE